MLAFIGYLCLAAALCYLLCSVNFAVLVSKIFRHDDVRDHGSGNAGMTNMMRVYGKVLGGITFAGDVLKGFVALWLCDAFILDKVAANAPAAVADFFAPQYMLYLCGLMSLIGHAYPLFFGFKGGKGVATTLGIFLFINPVVGFSGLAFFLLVIYLTGIVSLGSILAGCEMILANAFLADGPVAAAPVDKIYLALLGAAVIMFAIIMHKDNIKRLRRGEEKPLKVYK